jgi:excisionase family DNA binding protein
LAGEFREWIDRKADHLIEQALNPLSSPETYERGLNSHEGLSNLLAKKLRARGYERFRPSPGGPQFDVAWRAGNTLFIAEVKSTSAANETGQIRMGLGQILDYRWRFREQNPVAVLLVESAPADPEWFAICEQAGVTLLHPEIVEAWLDSLPVEFGSRSVDAANEELTTSEAAGVLNVSRSHLIKQLEAGALPCQMVGAHRRIRLADVLAYRDRVDAQARAALDAMAHDALYD